MRNVSLQIVRLLLVIFCIGALTISAVSAHEGREVGPYEIEFGWRVEPAYAGQMNGPEIGIIVSDTGEGFEGAETTLKIEVSFGPSTRELSLQPDSEEIGHYTADLIPTRPGDYTFRLFGMIGETEVDETFSAAEGQFSTIEPLTDLQFPDSTVNVVDLQAQIDELRAQIAELQKTPKQ